MGKRKKPAMPPAIILINERYDRGGKNPAKGVIEEKITKLRAIGTVREIILKVKPAMDLISSEFLFLFVLIKFMQAQNKHNSDNKPMSR